MFLNYHVHCHDLVCTLYALRKPHNRTVFALSKLLNDLLEFVPFISNDEFCLKINFQLALWVNENFLLQEQVEVDEKTEALDARFFSLRGAGMLFIQVKF